MKKTLTLLSALLLLSIAPSAWSADCVEVDIELPSTVVAETGAFAEGFFELTNCGDEAALVTLDVSLEIAGIPPFEVGGIQIPLGGGEVISRDFIVPVPPTAGGNEVTICVTGTIGGSSATDCATMVVEEGGTVAEGSSRTIGFMAQSENDCVDAMLELPDTVYAEPGSFGEGYFEIVNCGDEAAPVMLEVSFELMDTTITISGLQLPLGAGESISREFQFPVPPIVPDGEYGICITATIGEAIATSCQTVVVVGNNGPLGTSEFNTSNYPNPFNPSTTISFELPTTGHAKVTVYNSLGREVEVIQDGVMEAGSHSVVWDGSEAASGVYFYRIATADATATAKMLLMK